MATTRNPLVGGVGAGLATDAAGNIAYDPSANVLALVEAATTGEAKLREAEARLTAAKLDHQREVGELRAEHAKEIRDIEKTAQAATRLVDILNQERAVERQQAAILTLERTTQSNKEALSELVDRTAKALAQKTASDLQGVETRLGELERKSYLGAGKEALADPQMEKLVALVESLRESRSTTTGKGAGLNAAWIYLGGLVTLLAGLYLLGSKFFGH